MAVLKPEENKEEIKSVERLFPKVMRTNEIKNEINDIKIWESKIKDKYLKYETKNYIYGFQQYDTEKSFGDSIYTGNINRDEGDIDKTLDQEQTKMEIKKINTFESVNALYEGRELILNAFRNGIFPIKNRQ